MVPTIPLTSRFDDPSTGSTQTTYPPRAPRAAGRIGSSDSSETSALTSPVASSARTTTSFAHASSFLTASPWTFVAPVGPS